MARVTLGLCSVLAVLAVGAGTAAAGIDTYCGKNFSNFETCTGPFHTAITWSAGQHQNFADANRVCAGAYDSSGNFYGSYFCATGVACHVYGSDPLTPAVHDGEDHAATDVGVSYWSQAYPPGCPAGS
jgi:hypothetical protein